MIGILLLVAAVAIFWYYWNANKKWAKRGLSGPEPEFMLGNLREIWDYDKPRSIVLKEWSKKYGKIYGFYEGQRPLIVVSDYEMLNEIVVKKFDHFYARARFIMQERKDGPNTRIIEARGPHWKRLRTLGSMAFTQRSLKHIISTVDHSATLVVDGMAKQANELNALRFWQEYTLDVICKIALGMHDIKMFENEYLDTCIGIFTRPLRNPAVILSTVFPFAIDEIRKCFMLISKISPHPSPFAILMQMVKKNIEQRKKERHVNGNESTGDFIDLFLDAEVDDSEVQFGEDSDTAKKLSTEEIVGQCFIFLMAGFDTTSNSLGFVTHCLANHPEVQKKVVEEVDVFLAENGTLEVDKLNNLKYMEAVIKESLRHYPTASLAVTRECAKPCEIGGFKFEVGDQIATDTWTLHMDEKVWGPDAKEFRPERWLEEPSRPRAAFQSFGEGPRICLGMRLAYLEEKIALLKLLQRFTVKKIAKTNPIKLVGSHTVSPQNVMVKLVPR